MKRYFLFAGDAHYPGGGMKDFKGCFDTAEEARDFNPGGNCDWAHVWDSQEAKVVYAREEGEPWKKLDCRLELWH